MRRRRRRRRRRFGGALGFRRPSCCLRALAAAWRSTSGAAGPGGRRPLPAVAAGSDSDGRRRRGVLPRPPRGLPPLVQDGRGGILSDDYDDEEEEEEEAVAPAAADDDDDATAADWIRLSPAAQQAGDLQLLSTLWSLNRFVAVARPWLIRLDIICEQKRQQKQQCDAQTTYFGFSDFRWILLIYCPFFSTIVIIIIHDHLVWRFAFCVLFILDFSILAFPCSGVN